MRIFFSCLLSLQQKFRWKSVRGGISEVKKGKKQNVHIQIAEFQIGEETLEPISFIGVLSPSYLMEEIDVRLAG